MTVAPDSVQAKIARTLQDAFTRARHIETCRTCGERGPNIDPACQGECEGEE